jgi:uncharacterized protein
MCVLHKIAFVLLVVGGLNWGLVGLSSDWNLVHMILGSVPMLERLVYILVGVSALSMLGIGKCCMKDGACVHCGKMQDMPAAPAMPEEKKM